MDFETRKRTLTDAFAKSATPTGPGNADFALTAEGSSFYARRYPDGTYGITKPGEKLIREVADKEWIARKKGDARAAVAEACAELVLCP